MLKNTCIYPHPSSSLKYSIPPLPERERYQPVRTYFPLSKIPRAHRKFWLSKCPQPIRTPYLYPANFKRCHMSWFANQNSKTVPNKRNDPHSGTCLRYKSDNPGAVSSHQQTSTSWLQQCHTYGPAIPRFVSFLSFPFHDWHYQWLMWLMIWRLWLTVPLLQFMICRGL